MAALDLTTPAVLPTYTSTTLGTAGQMRRVNLPPGHGGLILTLRPLATDTKIVTLGSGALVADNTAIGANGFMPLDHDSVASEYIPRGCETVYLASATDAQVVYVGLNKPIWP